MAKTTAKAAATEAAVAVRGTLDALLSATKVTLGATEEFAGALDALAAKSHMSAVGSALKTQKKLSAQLGSDAAEYMKQRRAELRAR